MTEASFRKKLAERVGFGVFAGVVVFLAGKVMPVIEKYIPPAGEMSTEEAKQIRSPILAGTDQDDLVAQVDLSYTTLYQGIAGAKFVSIDSHSIAVGMRLDDDNKVHGVVVVPNHLGQFLPGFIQLKNGPDAVVSDASWRQTLTVNGVEYNIYEAKDALPIKVGDHLVAQAEIAGGSIESFDVEITPPGVGVFSPNNIASDPTYVVDQNYLQLPIDDQLNVKAESLNIYGAKVDTYNGAHVLLGVSIARRNATEYVGQAIAIVPAERPDLLPKSMTVMNDTTKQDAGGELVERRDELSFSINDEQFDVYVSSSTIAVSRGDHVSALGLSRTDVRFGSASDGQLPVEVPGLTTGG